MIASLPAPLIFAPIAFRQFARSTTSGSLAAFSMTVVPSASVAAIIRFSVPVTVTRSMTRRVALSLRAVAWMYPPATWTSAPIFINPSMCRLTGRDPMAQPPGSETTALPNRASMGPRTRMDARIDFTSSYGANSSRIVEQSTSMFIRSSTTSSTPIRPRSSMVVVMSCRCGMLPTLTGESASRVAASIGSAAFFAPEIRISPWSGMPPVMMSLSIRRGPVAPARRWSMASETLGPNPRLRCPSPPPPGGARPRREQGGVHSAHARCPAAGGTGHHRPIFSH